MPTLLYLIVALKKPKMIIEHTLLRKLLLIVLLCMIAPAGVALPIAVDGEPLPSLAPMLEKVQPAVVNLSTTTHLQAQENPLMRDPLFRRFFDFPEQQRSSSSLGSGVIVDAANGYIITNHHLIDQADQITVTTWDGRTLDAKLVGSDADSDIAVVKVDSEQLIEIPLGSSAALRVGDFVVAIGNPFGLSQTVTSGIVSALGRRNLGIEGYEDFIQTDASINPGNSGGALVNLRGELIGINTAIFSRSGGSVGIGFAIPIDMANDLMIQLVEHGNVRRGLLGVVMQDLTPSLADAFDIAGKKGIVVLEVIADSAAEQAGIREGDIIVGFAGDSITRGSDLRNAVGLLRAGAEAEVEFYRDGKLKTVEARIKAIDRLVLRNEKIDGRLTGAHFMSATPTAKHGGGVKIVDLEPNSPAVHSGLKENDIILTINRQRVKNLASLEKVLERAHKTLLIKLLRDNRMLFLVLQ